MQKNSFAAVTLKITLIVFCVFTFCGCVSKFDTSKQLSYKKISSSKNISRPVMAFSPSGKFLAVAKDKIIKLADPSTGSTLKTLTPEGRVFSLAFDPYEKHIALGMYRQVQIWNIKTQKLVQTIPAQSDIVTHVTFDPTGAILATGSRGADLNINFWNTTNWQHKNTLSMKDHDGYANNIQAMTFSQDGQYFSATGLDKKIHIWSAQAGKKIADISNNSKITALSLSPDGALVAAGDEDGKLKIWKIKTQERVSESVADSSLVHALSFNRKGDFLATAGESNIKLWNTSTWEYEKDIGFNKSGASVLFNSGNLTALVLAPGGAVSLYELTSQSYDLADIQPTKALAPMISVVSPDLNTETDLDSIKISGKVQGAVQIDKITILVNGTPLPERTIDRAVSSNDLKVVPFEENINLPKEGANEIKISAIDINGLEATEVIKVNKLSLEGKVWGVAIGIGNYENKEVNSLKYAASDARSFYNYLKDDYGIPKDNLFILTDSEATNKNIRDLLGVKIKKQARKNDTVIIYYAGHGAPEVDSTVDDGDGMEKYLIPYDADPASLFSTAIPMEEVSKILGRIKAERVAFIADTCFSGASDIKPGRTLLASGSNRTRAISKNFLKRLTRQSKGRVVLTASEANERSIENDKLQAGVFTHFLIRALKGEADANNDGFITTDEAYKFVSERVPDATDQEQHPVKKSDESGQLILGRVKK